VLVNSLAIENRPISLATHLETAYLMNNTTGVDILDISDPMNPIVAGNAFIPMLSISLHSGGGNLVSSSAKHGISLLPVHCDDSGGVTHVPGHPNDSLAVQMEAYPNPFNPRTTIFLNLGQSGSIDLEIINLRGQVIQALVVDSWLEAGDYQFHWDGANQNGESVSSGIYFARVETSRGYISKKLTLIR